MKSLSIHFYQRIALFSIFLISISVASFGQIIEPVKWKTDFKKISETEYELIYTATMEENWNVYSQFTEDGGPVPTSIYYDSIKGAEIVGLAEEFGHKKEGPDKLFEGINVIKYLSDEPFIIKQKINVTDISKPIIGAIEFMTCDDEKCLPPTFIDFTFALDGQKTTAAVIQGEIMDQTNPKIIASLKNPVGECGEVNEISQNYFYTFLFGFLGGLLALLTPCVFPMIPLTVSFFTKDTKRSGLVNALIYGGSIIVIYVLLGLIITASFGPEALNRLSTNWIANTIFFVVFIFFAFSFFGYYEITLPSSWSSKSDAMADKGGLLGIFFMAFTLALVSFSCTGPIIGSAIVQAASSGSYLGPSIVMLGFSLALAIPFGLFAAFPAWLNSLPRSGSWMNSVKVVLGFLELALAFKFLSVADMTNHWGFLKYELFLGIWVLCAIGLALYLFGLIKFPHDSPVKKLSKPRIGFASVSVITLLYLISGFFINNKTGNYQGLNLFSGLLPPAGYNSLLTSPPLDESIKAEFPSYSLCANNLPCFKEYDEGLAYAKKVNKPVFLDFTGHGCVNCRKTEDKIWVQDEVYNSLKNDWVLLSLYCDDDKPLDQQYISPSRNNAKIRNVGNKWADFQIINFEKNSQPLYVMMSNNEEILGHPRGYYPSVKEYIEFMDCGLKANNSLK